MKTILIKVIPYIVVFVAINIFIYNTSHFYKQETKYLNRIESSINSSSTIAFLGDSHSESIKHLNLSDKVGNLAFGADGIKEMYIKTLILDKYFKDLKYVFISTEPQMFNNSISSNSTFLNKYLLRLEDPKHIYNKTKLNLITEEVPLFNDNYLRYFLNSCYSKILNDSDDKNTGKTTEWSQLPEDLRKNMAIETGKTDHVSIMSNNEDLNIYKEIIKILKSKNVTVIGVRFPVNKHYLNQCDQKDQQKVNEFIKSLNLDANLDYSFKITEPLFFENEDHLNAEGMRKLALMIENDTGVKLTK